jgi:hypothetical protein
MKKSSAQKLVYARIQKTITGFQIPVMSISKLYQVLNAGIAAGKSDDDLKTMVSDFLKN